MQFGALHYATNLATWADLQSSTKSGRKIMCLLRGRQNSIIFSRYFFAIFLWKSTKIRFLIGCINIPNFTFNASAARTFQTELPILHFIWYLSHFPTGKRAILGLFRTYFSLGFWKSGLMFITLHYIGEAFISGQNVLSSIQLFKPGNIFF